jgi:Winged helix DNA-binding domain
MRLTSDDLAGRTLARQFPAIAGIGAASVLELFRRLGPIQSQVPRSPFLAVSSRLPGVDHATVCALFESHHLLKTSSLRGTVHTSGREHYPWLDAVARRGRAGAMHSQLGLQRVTPEELTGELEDFAADDWRARTEIVAHGRRWLSEHESEASAAAVTGTFAESLLWGHSGLLRRPKDEHWEKRTDLYHRRARALVPELGTPTFAESLTGLVRVYLRSLGPATRRDLAYFFGTGLGTVDAAVADLGEEIVRFAGPDDEGWLDVAEPPETGSGDPGLRLLPEFDALLVGYHGSHRTRFLTPRQLDQAWAKVNGQFAPIVLQHGRVVGTWKTASRGARSRLELSVFEGCAAPAEDELTEPVAALAAVLDLSIEEVRVQR